MSADTWYAISLTGYFVALIGLIVTVILYLKLDIPDVLGDLTGKTVARELKSMRENRNKGTRSASRPKSYNKTPSTSKNAKSSRIAQKKTDARTASKTAGAVSSWTSGSKKSKNGTAQMGRGIQPDAAAQPDKLVLHSKTDRLSRDTEELYEDFDPRVEYSRTDRLEEPEEQVRSRGTELLRPGTEVLVEETSEVRKPSTRKGTEVLAERGTAVLYSGTALLEDTDAQRGTCLLVEEEQVEPVKFSITRSYIVIHSEESI